jgi:hypothetical protein
MSRLQGHRSAVAAFAGEMIGFAGGAALIMPMKRSWPVARAAFLGLVVGVTGASAAEGDARVWQAWFSDAPALPATPDEARSAVVAHRFGDNVVVEAADPAWRQRALQAEALIAPVSAAAAAQFKATMERFNNDPAAARMAQGLEKALDDAERAMRRGERPVLRSADPQVRQLLADLEKPPDPSRLSPISAFLQERRQSQSKAVPWTRQFHDHRRHHARSHADLDKAPAGDAAAMAERVRLHQALARQQLQEARDLHAEARAALRPAVERLTELTIEAEQRGASAAERSQAYQWLKGIIEMLDGFARTTLEDVGFWAAVVPSTATAGPMRPTYRLALVPDVDLQPDGALPPMAVPYPRNRLPAPWPPTASMPR